MYGPTYDDNDGHSVERMDIDPVRSIPDTRKRANSPTLIEQDNYLARGSHTGSSKVPRHDRAWERSPRHDPLPYGGPHRSINTALEHDPWRGDHPKDHPPSSYGPAYPHPSPSPPLPPPPPPIPPPPPLTRTPPPMMPTPPVPAYPRRDEPRPAYPRREEEDDLTPPDEPFIRAVDRLLREDHDGWHGYFRASASNRACDVVKQYDFILRQCNTWVGKSPPGFNQPIEEVKSAITLKV